MVAKRAITMTQRLALTTGQVQSTYSFPATVANSLRALLTNKLVKHRFGFGRGGAGRRLDMAVSQNRDPPPKKKQ